MFPANQPRLGPLLNQTFRCSFHHQRQNFAAIDRSSGRFTLLKADQSTCTSPGSCCRSDCPPETLPCPVVDRSHNAKTVMRRPRDNSSCQKRHPLVRVLQAGMPAHNAGQYASLNNTRRMAGIMSPDTVMARANPQPSRSAQKNTGQHMLRRVGGGAACCCRRNLSPKVIHNVILSQVATSLRNTVGSTIKQNRAGVPTAIRGAEGTGGVTHAGQITARHICRVESSTVHHCRIVVDEV